MTKAEAIILLQSRADLIKSDYPDIGDYAEALLMAIKALNHFAGDSKKVSFSCGQEKDLISKADVCEILADVFPTDGEKVVYVEEIENAYQEIIELPYIQPFVIHCTDCEDWYKRQSVWNVAISELPSAQPEPEKYEYHYDHTDCIWYRPEARNRCPVTCAQYRDGWNDAMNYIFRDGKGYMPYRRDKQYEG